jgi:hypothetical protein
MWTFAGYRIIVDGDQGRPDPHIGIHDVLDGTESVIHYFGFGSPTRTLSAWLLDNPNDIEDLEDYCEFATPGELVSDQGSEGNWIITSISKQRIRDIKRVKPVWKLTIELKRA